MGLQTYRKKRDFQKTAEPKPKIEKSKGKLPIFVIQEHHATRLHWDFRLEAEGVLKSWAVTNEPTLDPAVKRLAVPTEDHPLDYATFAGDIPKGQYGGGHVSIWDHGTYQMAYETKSIDKEVVNGIKAGKLTFMLYGKKLEGEFALVRMHGGKYEGNWLLIKANDYRAKPGSAPPKVDVQKYVRSKSAGTKSTTAPARSPSHRPANVEFSHTEKIMFPQIKATKGDLLDYYKKVAPLLLPYLKDRPITLERWPDGVGDEKAPHFWQKNTPAYYPAWIARAKLPADDGEKTVDYTLVNDEQTLLYLVNQGAITFHTWFSSASDPDRPLEVLFDIDPHQSTFANAVKVAKKLHEVLDEAGVESTVKTTGKTGLHVSVPWKQKGGYNAARAWAEKIAKEVVNALPDIATTQRHIIKRGKRVYLDVQQNGKGKHGVPPYVVRTTPTATISMPLEWKQLSAKLAPEKFTIKTAKLKKNV